MGWRGDSPPVDEENYMCGGSRRGGYSVWPLWVEGYCVVAVLWWLFWVFTLGGFFGGVTLGGFSGWLFLWQCKSIESKLFF